MTTHPNTWKAAERRVAKLFGSLRQRLSGSSGRADETAADVKHPRLFIEVKYRAVHATRTLYDATAQLAKKEGKTPIVALVDKRKPGFLICIHVDDIPIVYNETMKAVSSLIGDFHEPE